MSGEKNPELKTKLERDDRFIGMMTMLTDRFHADVSLKLHFYFWKTSFDSCLEDQALVIDDDLICFVSEPGQRVHHWPPQIGKVA
jgi:hypothetical protein